MSIKTIEELRHARAAAFDGLKELNDKALAEERDFTAEEQQEYERREQEFESLGQKIERTEKLEGLGPKMTRSAATGGETTSGVEDDERFAETLAEFRTAQAEPKVQDSPEYRQAFYKWLSSADDRSLDGAELRVLSKASAGAGLNLVPTNFSNQLIQSLRFTGQMRNLATVISTDSGAALQVPTVSSHGTASWTAENASYSASDEAFGQATLNAYKAGTLIIVSEELLADAAFDLEAYIRNEFAQRIGILENTGYVVGDGSGKPTGVTTQATAGVVAAGTGTVTADELIDLYFSLSVPYRRNAVYLVSDAMIKIARKLKDSQNRYLWEPALTAGAPDTFLGKPIYADPDIPSPSTGVVSALFGDFSYYWIRDVNGIQMQRLNELYAANGQVGFRALHRTDGKLLNTAAVKKLTQA